MCSQTPPAVKCDVKALLEVSTHCSAKLNLLEPANKKKLSWNRPYSSCTRTIQPVVVSDFFFIIIVQTEMRRLKSSAKLCHFDRQIVTGSWKKQFSVVFRVEKCKEIHFMLVLVFQAIILIKILSACTSARFLTILNVCLKEYTG
jgi:hypothetical protein